MDPLLAQDVAHTCWEVAASALKPQMHGRRGSGLSRPAGGGCHGSLSNASYALDNCSFVSVFLSVFFIIHGPYSWITVKVKKQRNKRKEISPETVIQDSNPCGCSDTTYVLLTCGTIKTFFQKKSYCNNYCTMVSSQQ